MSPKAKQMIPRDDNRPIGVFDSGIGGLTVVSELRKSLPSEDICYLGDTARVPYGNKSVDSIIMFARQDVGFLVSKGVKAVIAACNTVSAVAMDDLRKTYSAIPVIGVLDAGVDAVLKSGARRITILGTRATVNSDAYRRAIHAVNPSLIVDTMACPLFVPLAEEGLVDEEITFKAFDLYLSEIRREPPEVLLLGCTHYPLLKKALAEYIPKSVRIIDSAEACAAYAAEFIKKNSISASVDKHGQERYFVTDMPNDFHGHATRFLGYRVRHVEKVSLA